jgi:hypothetical protein
MGEDRLDRFDVACRSVVPRAAKNMGSMRQEARLRQWSAPMGALSMPASVNLVDQRC